jgi:aspartyl-tRNA(Asn)/glutamyl-tRNA(Gln) amidotransferase subunit A
LPIHVQTVTAEASQAYWNAVTDAPSLLGEDVLVRLEAGQFLTAVDYVKAQQLRTAMRAALQDILSSNRILITPTVATTAPRRGDENVVINGKVQPLHPALTRFTTPFNQTGLPAITLPCGTNAAGHPIGIQLAAAYGNDAFLLQAAWEVEQTIKSCWL